MENQIHRNLVQSKILNNCQTFFQFSKELLIELIKGSATPEHVEVLKVSVEGLKEFIGLIEEKLKEKEKQEIQEKEANK